MMKDIEKNLIQTKFDSTSANEIETRGSEEQGNQIILNSKRAFPEANTVTRISTIYIKIVCMFNNLSHT